jgi:hypothetical protein
MTDRPTRPGLRARAWGPALGLLAASLFVLAPDGARAAACCVGSTSDQAARLGPCETALVGISYGADGLAGHWDSEGRLLSARSAPRLDHAFVGFFALRIDSRFQVGATMPLRLQAVAAGDLREVGVGPGDLTLFGRVEPFPNAAGAGPPLPAFGLGLVLPTGIPPEAAPGQLGAFATGRGYLAFAPSIDLERTFGKGVFRLSVDGLFSIPRPWDEDRAAPGVGWGGTVAGSFFLGVDTTLAISGGARGVSPGRFRGAPSGKASVEPWLGLGVSLGLPRFDRLGLGLRGSLPIPHIGRNTAARVLFTVTYTHVRRRPLRAPKPHGTHE